MQSWGIGKEKGGEMFKRKKEGMEWDEMTRDAFVSAVIDVKLVRFTGYNALPGIHLSPQWDSSSQDHGLINIHTTSAKVSVIQELL
jgi:hypothetical protein